MLSLSKHGGRIFAAGLAALLMAAPAAADQSSDVALTWDRYKAVLPGSIAWIREREIRDVPSDLAAPHSIPAIVYIHGSTGFGGEMNVFRAWTEAGFVVFIPDSFKRPGRVPNCDPKTLKCGMWPDVYRHRNEEIAYAASAVSRVPFVDPKRIVLIGHSEGGIAVAQYGGIGFAGVVISGWNCGPWTICDRHIGNAGGIKSPPSVPVLSIYSQRDPWFTTLGGLNGDCSRYFAGRAPSQALFYDSDIHYMLDRREIRRAVIDFARSVTGDK